jgi:ribonuclease J
LPSLSFVPLGGFGEIGKNMALLEWDNQSIMIDAGLMFPDEHHPGIDYIIPDFNEYLEAKPGVLKAVFLTHGHEDHIGAVPYLLQKANVPVYGSPLTIGFVRAKLNEVRLPQPADLHVVEPGSTIEIGPFKVEFLRVTHSIVDGCGLAITTPAGVVIHTGDFKIDPTPVDGKQMDLNRFAEYGSKGVLMLMSDSTNVEREGYTLSEKVVGEEFDKIFPTAKQRIIVACFASNIHRVQQAVEAALKIGRKVCIMGRSMVRNTQVARELGYLDIPSDMIIQPEHLRGTKRSEVLIVTTGSQGEPMSSVSRMAHGDHKYIDVESGDLVLLSARTIPGNERAISSIINQLYRRGAEVLYEAVSEIHVSGHACREEQKILLQLVKPKYFVPVHGEYRHLLLHARLAEEVGIPENRIFLLENGERLTVEEDTCSIEEATTGGTILIDGKDFADVGEVVMRDRQHLSQDGVIVAIVNVDVKKRRIIGEPELVTRGFTENVSEVMMAEAKQVIRGTLEAVATDTVQDWGTVKEAVRKSLNKYFVGKSDRRPMVLPIIMEI